MAVYRVVENGDPVLRKVAKEVGEVTPNIQKLIKNMAETMYEFNGVGLAAPQVGISKRVIVVDIQDGSGLHAVVNPKIVEYSGVQDGTEGCLSCPNIFGDVLRAQNVVVEGLDQNGEPLRIEAEGFFARAFQHEIDHLDGVLFIDKAKKLVKGE